MSSIELLKEERFINWNFVSSSKERLERAKADWMGQRFPKEPEEKKFVPYFGTKSSFFV